MAFMLASLRVPLSWMEVLRRTFKEAFFNDNCLGMAAQLAYYFLFALFPALLVVMAIADIFATDVLQMVNGLRGVVPSEAVMLVNEQLGRLTNDEEQGLLTFGMLAALWSSSAAMTAIIDTLNNAYDIEEGRPWWKVRLTAIVLTVGISLFIVMAFALVVAGPTVAERLADRLYLGPAFEWSWKILQWPLVFALASGGIAIIYYFAPDAEQDWVWLTPGSVFATTLWLLASLGFKYYLANVGGYESYGVVGGVMVLMLWFYLSGLVILLGAEMNAEIEHASAYGKAEGEKVPGQRRKIGPALTRTWASSVRHRGKAPSAAEVKEVVGDTPEAHPPALGTAPEQSPAVLVSSPSPAASGRDAARDVAPAAGGLSNWLIGAPLVAMQALWTLRLYRSRARS